MTSNEYVDSADILAKGKQSQCSYLEATGGWQRMVEHPQGSPTSSCTDLTVTKPCRIAEDDGLRSREMRRLIQDGVSGECEPTTATIPRVVIQFWHDSKNIPRDVQECLDSWQPLDSRGFKRVLFDDLKARRFISKAFGGRHLAAFDRCHHPAMRCDYFRLCYLLQHGGFYVDADEYYQGGDYESLFRDVRLKIQPLCYDVTTATMIPYSKFATEQTDSPDWIFYVNNNPIVAPAFHPVVRLALFRSTVILLSNPENRLEIQSTTGPGNFTASLIKHAITSENQGWARDFLLLANWETISVSKWPLGYRNDERNWRLWNRAEANI